MRRIGGIAGILIVSVVLFAAAPVLGAEPGVTEVASVDHNEDFSHAVFAHTLINHTEEPVDIAPRNLNDPGYPVLTLITITIGTFADGIWTIGTLAPGQMAYIEYTGDNPAATMIPTLVQSNATESLPSTGPGSPLVALAVVGLALIGIGVSVLRAARD